MSSKNPTIRRILKEAAELNASPASDYHAAPLENDLFEWHFTLRGPPAPSPYDGGLYHGRIVLPPAYPLKPPSFRFTTPTGRFEVNREICLSISGHHEETWQPAWGIRTALVAIRSFMDTDAKGQVGGMDSSDTNRRRLAIQSRAWKCAACGNSNAMIMKQHQETISATGGESSAKETVPEELRLAYREDLDKAKQEVSTSTLAKTADSSTLTTSAVSHEASVGATAPTVLTDAPRAATRINNTPQVEDALPEWIDKAIYGIILALIALVWARYG